MHPVAILFGLGCGTVVFVTRRDGYRHRAAWGLLALWAVANLMWQYGHISWLPLADWLLGIGALMIWLDTGEDWAAKTIALCYLRLGLHVGREITGEEFHVIYLHAINAMFAAMLWVVAGGGDGFRLLRLFRDRYRVHPRRSAPQ